MNVVFSLIHQFHFESFYIPQLYLFYVLLVFYSIHENVKYATALIIEKIEKADEKIEEIGNLKSQNIEGWSESYTTPEEIKKDLESEKINILHKYLWNIIGNDGQPLLYCGVL